LCLREVEGDEGYQGLIESAAGAAHSKTQSDCYGFRGTGLMGGCWPETMPWVLVGRL
jgi:hypothetical protein